MIQQEIQLTFSAKFGSDVLSSDKADTSVKASEARVVPIASAPNSLSAHHDFGATVIAVLGTAATVAAVKGLFGLFKTLVEEAHKTKRLRYAQEHEARMLLMSTAHEQLKIDLDEPLDVVLSQVAQFEDRVVNQ